MLTNITVKSHLKGVHMAFYHLCFLFVIRAGPAASLAVGTPSGLSGRSRTPDNFLENSSGHQRTIKPPMMRSVSSIAESQAQKQQTLHGSVDYTGQSSGLSGLPANRWRILSCDLLTRAELYIRDILWRNFTIFNCIDSLGSWKKVMKWSRSQSFALRALYTITIFFTKFQSYVLSFRKPFPLPGLATGAVPVLKSMSSGGLQLGPPLAPPPARRAHSVMHEVISSASSSVQGQAQHHIQPPSANSMQSHQQSRHNGTH